MNRYWRDRLRRNGLLAIVAVCLGELINTVFRSWDLRQRMSLASAYVALIYLALSLSLGPYRVWRKLSNPISFDLRRDIGIWAGFLALVHTILGLMVHLRGRMWMYFLASLSPMRMQISWFGLANYLGGMATLLFVLLLAISNDRSLRELGTKRWKFVQRCSYVAAILTIVHGFAYQFVEKRRIDWVIALAVLVCLTLGLQLAGFSIVRRKRTVSTETR